MRVPTRKQLNNLKARKDPRKRAKSTKVHDDKHAYNRNKREICEGCGSWITECECADNLAGE